MKSDVRTRLLPGSLVVGTIILGLGIRARGELFPRLVRDFAPDALWAMMVFFLVLFLWPRLTSRRAALFAALFSFAIEASQLLQFSFLREVRATTPGALVLGHGFLWSDIACYAVGIAVGYVVHRALSLGAQRNAIRRSR